MRGQRTVASRTGLIVLATILLAWCPRAWGQSANAFDAGLDMSQYAHTAWRVRDGFTKGVIHAIAQTPDGYLWLGTEYGLYRFDGVKAVPWQSPERQQLPANFITNMLVARDGTLWIATLRGLGSWKDGKASTRWLQTKAEKDTMACTGCASAPPASEASSRW